MKLIVGLGNPGREYKKTRHNIGYMLLDKIALDKGISFDKERFNAKYLEYTYKDEKILMIKPLSYMNLSGEVVVKYVQYYKIDIGDILVIQDDLDLAVGRYKLMFKHGDGGHNGIKNIISNLNSKEFLRLKIGISKNTYIDTKDYVLGKFSGEELKIINNTFSLLKDFISDYVNLNRDLLMGKYNTKNNI